MPPSPPLYEAETTTDESEDDRIAELIREAALEGVRDELPHSLAATVDDREEREDGLLELYASLYVERDSQKGIIIGKQGKALKKVATEARRSLEKFFGKSVFLETFVKVDKDWRSSDRELKNFGYQLD